MCMFLSKLRWQVSSFLLQAFSYRQKSLLSSWKQQALKICQPLPKKYDRRYKGYVFQFVLLFHIDIYFCSSFTEMSLMLADITSMMINCQLSTLYTLYNAVAPTDTQHSLTTAASPAEQCQSDALLLIYFDFGICSHCSSSLYNMMCLWLSLLYVSCPELVDDGEEKMVSFD